MRWFSILFDRRDIHRAMQNPIELDMRQAIAVDTRIELDLRIGAAFTRFQTLKFRDIFEELENKIISYGMPTLFVVECFPWLVAAKPDRSLYPVC